MATLYERHEFSAAWPDYSDEAFADLVEDVRVHGIINPIVVYERKILDGWHRYRAALEVPGTSLPIIVYEEEPDLEFRDPRDYVISLNAHRRMLTVSQRAMAIAGVRDPRKPGNPDWTGETGMIMQDIADEANASVRTMQSAYKVLEDEELRQQVLSGDMTINEAVRTMGQSESSADTDEDESLETRQSAPDNVEPMPDRSPTRLVRGTKAELQARLDTLEDDLEVKAEQVDELRHRVEFLEGEQSPVEAVREQKFNNLIADNKSYKAGSESWQAKYADVLEENKHLHKNIDHLSKQNAELKRLKTEIEGKLAR